MPAPGLRGDALPVPADVRAVLTARIARLGQRDKRVLQSEAVIGKNFSAPLLEHVLAAVAPDCAQASESSAALHALIDAEFLYEEALYPIAEYAFRHPLTQEIALGSQLLERRRRTHAAVAEALTMLHAEQIEEQAALLAHHYEQAGDPSAPRWHLRAAEWVGIKNIPAALDHWRRVRDLVRGAQQAHAHALMVSACSRALLYSWRAGGSSAEWQALFDEGCAAAERGADLPSLAMLNSGFGATIGFNQGRGPDFVRYASAAVCIADCSNNDALRCASRARLAVAHLYCCQLSDAIGVADETIALAAGDPHFGAQFVGYSPLLTAGLWRVRGNFYQGGQAQSLQELPSLRALALECDFRELAQYAVQLAEPLGIGNQITAAPALCHAFESAGEWRTLLDTARDEYAALLTSSGFHLYQGELHELRACLTEREGRAVERTAALARAHDCYTRFEMIHHAEY